MKNTYPTSERPTSKLVALATIIGLGTVSCSLLNRNESSGDYSASTVHDLAVARDDKTCPVGLKVKLAHVLLSRVDSEDLSKDLYNAVDDSGPESFQVVMPDDAPNPLPNTTSYTLSGKIIEPPCTLDVEQWDTP